MSQLSPTQFRDAVRKVMARAAADELFHALCLKDPAEAAACACARQMPEHLKLRFVECAAGEVLVTLPPLWVAGEAAPELSIWELDQVVGGMLTIEGYRYWANQFQGHG